MKAKKELIIIILIVITSLVLVFLPMIINNPNNNSNNEVIETTEVKTNNTITITVYGEITYQPINSINDDEITNTLSFECMSGITYGEIINRIDNYLTGYSIIDDDLTKRYFDSSKIYIKSSNTIDIEEEAIDNNIGKININTATVDELDDLPGIGIKRASRIIEYIKTNGKIESFSELKSLIGVSDEVIELIKEKAFL